MSPEELKSVLDSAKSPVFFKAEGKNDEDAVRVVPELLFVGSQVFICDEGEPLKDRQRSLAQELCDLHFLPAMQDVFEKFETSHARMDWAYQSELEYSIDDNPIFDAFLLSVSAALRNPMPIIVKDFTLTAEALAIIRERMGLGDDEERGSFEEWWNGPSE